MKKSEIYRLAQGAVVMCEMLSVPDKLEILRELMSKEDLERFTEEKEAKGA